MAKNKRLRMVLSGAGFIGREHLTSAQDLDPVEYVGLVDVCAEAAEKVAAEHDLPLFDDLEKAIAALKPDAVDVCVPTPYHLSQVETCAANGVHVLCEKPMERTVDAARRMAACADEAKIRIMIAQVIRFWPEYRYVREMAANGRYGAIVSVDCKRQSSPPGWSEWFMDERRSGGAVVDLQIHDMDFVLQLLGRPQAVLAQGREYGGGLNAIMTQLEYGSGVPVTLETSFIMPKSYPFRMFFKVEFEQATLEMDFWRDKEQRLKMYPADGEVKDISISGAAYRDEIDYFARQLATGRPFELVPVAESIEALELCCVSAQACRTRSRVAL